MKEETRGIIGIIIAVIMWFNFLFIYSHDIYSYNNQSGRDALLPRSFYYDLFPSIIYANFQIFSPIILGFTIFKVLPKN